MFTETGASQRAAGVDASEVSKLIEGRHVARDVNTRLELDAFFQRL